MSIAGFGLGEGFRHHHALAGGEAVGFDDQRRAAAPRVGFGRSRIDKTFIAGGRYAVGPAQVLGEAFGAFEPRGGACRSKGLDAGGLEIVDNAGAQRRLRADHD